MKPYYEDKRLTLWYGDSRIVLPTLPENSADSCVTDPPYDLTSGKRTVPPPFVEGSPYSRHRMGVNGDNKASRGFMGKEWDGTGVAFDPATWVEVLRVLKPGAYLLAFGGTRTYHRMVCAIEDAGFEIRDQIQWIYGSGFPKSLNLGNGFGTALKPAHEPIVLARKPLIGTVAANVSHWGTGGLNIDACRVEGSDGNGHWSGDDGSDATSRPGYDGGFTAGGSKADGRWPANVIHDGSEEVLVGFPDTSSGSLNPTHIDRGKEAGRLGKFTGRTIEQEFGGDSGSAARFFYAAKASKEDRDEGLEDLMPRQRDESRKEGNPGGDNPRNRGLDPRKNHHPTVKPTDLMRYLCRLITPPGGIVLDPFAGSGSTGKAAALENMKAILIEREEEYCELAAHRARLRQAILF